MINVTKTYFPPIELYQEQIKRIWKNGWITNNGELVRELEEKLKNHLGVKHLFYVSNGTIALQIALKVLDISKEVITTPFSYVATTSSLLWENCTPRFVDINQSDFGIDPTKIESIINENTEAILATHVYGVPNKIDDIKKITKRYNLKLIFDAAHCFGTRYNGQCILNYGDISTISFHATKLFHTIEGGAIVTNDDELAYKIDLYRRFGHSGDDYFTIGINGKNSEVHAAMGLTLLPMVNDFIKVRRELIEYYEIKLEGLGLVRPTIENKEEYNYAYFPIVFENEKQLLKVKNNLEENDIYPRRYFYPSLNELPYIKKIDDCPISESISRRVLCLPLYYELNKEIIDKVASIVRNTLSK